MSEELRKYVEDALNNEGVTLVTLKGGAALEMFDRELRRVMENIADINTTAKPREIVLKVKAWPVNNSRSMVGFSIVVPPAKLCGQEPEEDLADIDIAADGSGPFARRREVQEQLKITNVVKLNG